MRDLGFEPPLEQKPDRPRLCPMCGEETESVWHLSRRTFLAFVLRIQLVICQRITESQIVSSSRMNLGILRERQLAYGLKIFRR